MNRHRTEADALKADLQDAETATNYRHNIKQYIDRIPELLAKADVDKQVRMKILENFGIGVYMYPGNEYKKVNWTLFGKSMRLERTPIDTYTNYDILAA